MSDACVKMSTEVLKNVGIFLWPPCRRLHGVKVGETRRKHLANGGRIRFTNPPAPLGSFVNGDRPSINPAIHRGNGSGSAGAHMHVHAAQCNRRNSARMAKTTRWLSLSVLLSADAMDTMPREPINEHGP
jgi:hypothetical protein